MAKRLRKHSARLLGSVSILDLSGKTAYRGLHSQFPATSKRPAAARVAERMSAGLKVERQALTSR